MEYRDRLIKALDLNPLETSALKKFCKKAQITLKELRYYNANNILPTGSELENLMLASGKSLLELKLGIGNLDQNLKELLAKNSSTIAELLASQKETEVEEPINHKKVFNTGSGTLYEGDCLSLLKSMDSESVDLVFADPPFNLKKFYLSGMNDNLTKTEYLNWSEKWIAECSRVLKKGGSFFLWNLPKWNTYLGEFLNQHLTFRHWIATDIKYSLPIQGRLYPSHYSLLYYVKGEKPKTFHPDRMAMSTCPKCYNDLKDYGGYKNKMNPKGINLTDIWLDIPPVRHKKYKTRAEANELSIKLLDRVIELSSDPGDIIFDPFGGSGCTYVVAELKKRKWIGVELGSTDQIITRFSKIEEEKEYLEKYRSNYNSLFPNKIKRERTKRNLWTTETFEEKQPNTEKHLLQGELFTKK